MSPEQHKIARDFTELPGVRVDVVERVTEKVLVEADLPSAAGLVIGPQDDVANIHVALLARELVPTLRLVIRMYNTGWARRSRSCSGTAGFCPTPRSRRPPRGEHPG
jgi:Trk K+ transport system NAD-binding subunit